MESAEEGLSWEAIAASTYRAYGQSVNNKNYQGLPMPTWEALPLSIRMEWHCAVRHTSSLVAYLPETGVSKMVPSIEGLAMAEQTWAGKALVDDTPRTGAQIVEEAIDRIGNRGEDQGTNE